MRCNYGIKGKSLILTTFLILIFGLVIGVLPGDEVDVAGDTVSVQLEEGSNLIPALDADLNDILDAGCDIGRFSDSTVEEPFMYFDNTGYDYVETDSLRHEGKGLWVPVRSGCSFEAETYVAEQMNLGTGKNVLTFSADIDIDLFEMNDCQLSFFRGDISSREEPFAVFQDGEFIATDSVSEYTPVYIPIEDGCTFDLDAAFWDLEVSSDEGGIIRGEEAGRFAEGEKIVLKAVPEEGYVFGGWELEGSSEKCDAEEKICEFEIEEDTFVRSSFVEEDEPIEPPWDSEVELNVDSGDLVEVVEPGEGEFSFEEGQAVDLVAEFSPDLEHEPEFSWIGDLEAVEDPDSHETMIVMWDDYHVKAVYEGEKIERETFEVYIYSGDFVEVVEPGEGYHEFKEGEVVELVAEVSPDLETDKGFSWIGDIRTLEDSESLETQVEVQREMEIGADIDMLGDTSYRDCIDENGEIAEADGEYICRIEGDSCPSGWEQYEEWSTTESDTCTSSNFFCGSSCSTDSHEWDNEPIETCTYQRTRRGILPTCRTDTCEAELVEVGCIRGDAPEEYEEETYDLMINVYGRGTTQPSGRRRHSFEEGEEVVVTAEPAEGFLFAGFRGDCQGTENCTLEMNYDKRVTATFERDRECETDSDCQHLLCPQAVGMDTPICDPETNTCKCGDGEEEEVVEEYGLNIDIEGEGSTEPPEGFNTFEEGESVELVAESEDGWKFDRWSGRCSGSDKECELTMNSDKNVTAHFKETELIGEGSFDDCVSAEGEVVEVDDGYICRFDNSRCPHPRISDHQWEQYKDWSSTSSDYCSSSNILCGTSCNTESHDWANEPVETCTYERTRSGISIGCTETVCRADVDQIGCIITETDEEDYDNDNDNDNDNDYENDNDNDNDDEEEKICEPGETRRCSTTCTYRECGGVNDNSCRRQRETVRGEMECRDDGTWGSCSDIGRCPEDQCRFNSDCRFDDDEDDEFEECVENCADDHSSPCWGDTACCEDRCS